MAYFMVIPSFYPASMGPKRVQNIIMFMSRLKSQLDEGECASFAWSPESYW
jgi:hypothetical protein